ncbi:MAG: hypothetical protein QOG95_4149 [Mycobacterium sp.]|nr:hypothetical protein [Mycobacterium sp.]
MPRKGPLVAWLALIAGIGLQAVVTALLGLSFTAADSLLMLALAAAVCTLIGAVAARGNRCTLLEHKQGVRALVWLNVWTAISFVAFFLGVGIHSAAVVFTLEASFAPLVVTAWAVVRVHRGDDQARPGPAQGWAASLLAVLGTSLVVVMAQSDSGGMISFLAAALLGVIAGVAAGGVVIVSRGLGGAGVGVVQVMAHRFYATVIFAAIVLLTLVPYGLLAPPVLNIGVIGAAALTCLVAPLFLLQYGMQRLTPLSVTAALATMPAITIAIELASGRPVSWIILFLGLLIVPANLALLVTQRPELTLSRLSLLRTTLFDTEHRTQPAVTTV